MKEYVHANKSVHIRNVFRMQDLIAYLKCIWAEPIKPEEKKISKSKKIETLKMMHLKMETVAKSNNHHSVHFIFTEWIANCISNDFEMWMSHLYFLIVARIGKFKISLAIKCTF